MIKLPEPIECSRCGGTGGTVTDCPYCTGQTTKRGYRYDFDDLAAAVREADLFYELKDPYPNKDADQCRAEIVNQPNLRGWNGICGTGPTPTAALLSTIKKVNEEADGNG